MGENDARIYAVQEAILIIDSLAIHSRTPYLVKYYNFTTRSLKELLKALRKPPPQPKKTLHQLLCEIIDN